MKLIKELKRLIEARKNQDAIKTKLFSFQRTKTILYAKHVPVFNLIYIQKQKKTLTLPSEVLKLF